MSVVHWVLKGLEYGYPTCCIDDFVSCMITNGYRTRSKRQLHGTGYIPCSKCNQLTEKELIEYINNHRSDKLNLFPNPERKVG